MLSPSCALKPSTTSTSTPSFSAAISAAQLSPSRTANSSKVLRERQAFEVNSAASWHEFGDVQCVRSYEVEIR
jgi:hypothetical protein